MPTRRLARAVLTFPGALGYPGGASLPPDISCTLSSPLVFLARLYFIPFRIFPWSGLLFWDEEELLRLHRVLVLGNF